MNIRPRLALCVLLPVAALAPLFAAASDPSTKTHDSPEEHSGTTLILAGGALPVCSDLGVRACSSRPSTSQDSRTPPRYRMSPEALYLLASSDTWPKSRAALAEPLGRLLALASMRLGDAEESLETLEDLLFNLCLDDRRTGRCPPAERSPWQRLTDAERTRVLSALEQPQIDAHGLRLRERVHPTLGAKPHGMAVLRRFVEEAAQRSHGHPPRVLVVTASALDPMEPVDFYLSAFTALGAQAQWWPLDAALARALENGDCQALSDHRLAVLGLHARETVYPDLHALQQQACAQPDELLAQLRAAQGVFFAGGDQWRLRQAFFGADDRPLPWLRALRAAHERGTLVAGGTSAGAAVQSGAAMLTNGSPESALNGPARSGLPPEPGCARAELCDEADESALSIWPAGGLGLAREAIVDTHFSERAREPRLLRLLAQTSARYGFGVDEASALVLREDSGQHSVEAIGEHGGWVFVRDPVAAPSSLQAQVFHLGPGTRLEWPEGKASVLGGDVRKCPAPVPPVADAAQALVSEQGSDPARAALADALAPGALRSAAQRLARCDLEHVRLRAADGSLLLERLPETRVTLASDALAIGPLRLRWIGD
jgi:cyanophycinase